MGVAGYAGGFDYTVTVTNNGPASHTGSVTVSDTLPAGTTYSAAGSDPGCGALGQVVTCTSAATLANAATLPFIIHVTIPSAVPNGTVLSNSATLSSTGTNDGNASNDTSNTTTTSVFGAPVGLSATAAGTVQVDLTWTPNAGADHYEIYRSFNNGGYASAGTSPGAAFSDMNVTPGVTYLYIVRAVTAGSIASPFSALDPATTIVFTDDPLVAMTTTVRAVHLTELRTAVDAFRASAGLTGGSYSDLAPAGIAIKTAHIQELRNALDPARAILGLSAIGYADPTLTPLASVVRTAHVQQIRDGVK